MSSARPPLAVKIFVLFILALGMGALFLLGRHSEVPPLLPFLTWTALLVITEATAIELPRGGYISVSGVVDYAGILCYGPLLVGWADVTGVLIFQGLWKRRPLSRVMFNAGLYSLTSVVAGKLYLLAGGKVGSPAIVHSLPPLLVLGVAYFGVNSCGLSAVISLAERRPFLAQWRDNFRWGLLQHWSLLPLGMLFALVAMEGGLGAVALVTVPLLLARWSFMAHLRARTDLKDFVRAISKVLDQVDPFTREHSLRVAQYATRVARDLGLPLHEVEMIEYAALMHDLGKITPEARPLIEKPGLLTREEKEILNSHPTVGAALFEQVRSLRPAAIYVRAHHERLDGRGYPQGLRGDEIPLGARILTVCDCYDAMTSDRPYVCARSVEAGLLELHRNCEVQFDPRVVACFARIIAREREAAGAPLAAPLLAQMDALARQTGVRERLSRLRPRKTPGPAAHAPSSKAVPVESSVPVGAP